MKDLFLTGILFFLAANFCFAQEGADSNRSLTDNESVRLPADCPQTNKDWAQKDVLYIITEEEKKSFSKLETFAERERFIESFWSRRDPDPDTEVNEFREEYYQRIEFANDNFASGIPGWKTDRGKIYILYGQPDKTEKAYSAFKNNTSILYEKWHYDYLAGIGEGIEIFFIDPMGTDEFRLLKAAEGKFLEVYTRDMSEETLKLLQ